MRGVLSSILFGAGLATSAFAEQVSYDGAKAVRIPIGEDVTPLYDLIRRLDLPTWKGVTRDGIPHPGGNVDLVVPADKVSEFDALTKDLFEVEVMHEDLGASIAAESGETSQKALGARADATWFNSYHAYADHLTFLKQLVAQYPTRAEIIYSGKSNAGRDITGIHIWGSGGKDSKPAIVLHGTVHAREWISGMTVEYLLYQLISNYGSNAEIKGFVDKYDFYFLPVVNPDGFVYTQTNERLWRKNRQSTPNSNCIGRDINRNWPYQWNLTAGGSNDPCDETFRGRAAGDSPENLGMRSFINNLVQNGKGVQMFIDVHSYAQLFMTPYGYTCTGVPSNNAQYQIYAKGAATAIQAVYGTQYKYGPKCTTIYQSSGSSTDYLNDVAGVKWVFTIELRDTGKYGFVLPASQIVPTGKETWAGFRYLLLNLKSSLTEPVSSSSTSATASPTPTAANAAAAPDDVIYEREGETLEAEDGI